MFIINQYSDLFDKRPPSGKYPPQEEKSSTSTVLSFQKNKLCRFAQRRYLPRFLRRKKRKTRSFHHNTNKDDDDDADDADDDDDDIIVVGPLSTRRFRAGKDYRKS